jgi:hypothetical protein
MIQIIYNSITQEKKPCKSRVHPVGLGKLLKTNFLKDYFSLNQELITHPFSENPINKEIKVLK